MFIAEHGRDSVLDLLSRATVVATARIAYVECRAAFSRAAREGRLQARTEAASVRNLNARWPQLLVVELDESLAREAGELTRAHPLRASDAIHLASAGVIASTPREEVMFACWDRRLWAAAGHAGFTPVPPIEH